MGLNKSQDILSSRTLIGIFWQAFHALVADQTALLNRIAFPAESENASEKYGWLGQVPKMREWIGARAAAKLVASDYEIKNKHFEATLEFLVKDLRRDKTNQIRARIGDLASTAGEHMYELIVALMNAGAATACYDGQEFYDTDHLEGDSGQQSNDLAVTAVDSAIPTQLEMAKIIKQMLEALYGFKDEKGRAMNRGAKQFSLVVPVTYWGTALAAVSENIIEGAAGAAVSNPLGNLKGMIQVELETGLTAKTMHLLRTDATMKPFIAQRETDSMEIKAKAEGSEFAFDHDAHQYGVDAWHNAGYGLWQYAVLATVTDA
ncbi:MAG: Mu-like prophage major head subunit gpT family protein [Nitrospirales bacterium]